MFKHERNEEKQIIEATDTYRAKIGDYDVVLTRDEHVTKLWLSPANWNDVIRLPLFDCHPKSATELETLADALPDIFRAIVKELRESGMEDLRGKWDKWRDDMDAGLYRDIKEYK